jgi:peptidoglycan/xylan/chitin deacetylase (PgdA/CDA1 family)
MRDLVGYANRKLDFSWPQGKRLALSIVVNFEEGSEHSIVSDGIVEGVGEFPPVDIRTQDVGNESNYEYGSRVGVWRILRLLDEQNVKATFFATATSLELNRAAASAIVSGGHEICDHGLRWTEHYRMGYEEEKQSIKKSADMIEEITGRRPVGFYAREPSVSTIRIVQELGFLYDSDAYNDDVPYRYGGDGILILPYTPDVNDFHFQYPMNRFATSTQFYEYMKDSFDVLREEAKSTPKMMTVGLHCRVTGRPGRILALKRFLEYVRGFDDVWVATREDIARYWINNVEKGGSLKPHPSP